MATVLVTGISGGLARLVARKLLKSGHEVIGVDYRHEPAWLPDGVKFYRASYNKTSIEDIFKHHTFDAVLHLGRVGNLREEVGKRFDLNVIGTQKIMNLCVAGKVKRLIVLSTFHIYGAHPANHTPIFEDDPLRGGVEFPQIADAIQLDNMATTWIYKHPEVSTAVIRSTNVVGPHIRNTMSSFLRQATVPHLLGFNPMTQFIHEEDLSDAIIAALERPVAGVFNVSGESAIPWCTALELARAGSYPVPVSLVSLYLAFRPGFPQYLINFFKYPCVISDRAFREAFQWVPKVPIEDTIWTTVAEARDRQRAG